MLHFLKIIAFILVLLLLSGTTYVIVMKKNVNEIGLSVLTWVKNIKGENVDFSSLSKQERPLAQHDLWDVLLKQNVTADGIVNYQGFVDQKIELVKYLDHLTAFPPGLNWTEAEAITYWINAYNAFTVKLIVDHYPLESIKKISSGLPMINSPWDIKFFKIGSIDFDLNTIEHEILRKLFHEPRIHFAINCASYSCPNLRNEAYVADRLEEQLEEQARSFVNDPNKNKITKDGLELSQIFNWFASDFTKEKSLLDYVQNYTDVPINKNVKVDYKKYLWTLNGK